MDKSEFPFDFDGVHSQPDETLPNHYEDTSVIYPPVNYVPGRLFRPRMVARSSVNSKRLSNTTISLISIPAPDHTTPMPSMQRINRIPHLNQSVNSNARLSVFSGTQSAQETNPPLGSHRRGPISNPLSAVTATTGRGGESQSFPASFYPVSVGGGATGGTGAAGSADEGVHLLNIDDLLIRRNRPTSKTSSRGRHNTRSAQQPLPPLVVVGSGSPSAPPVISYQENAIQTRLELLPTVPDGNNDSNVYQCEKEQEEMEKLAKPPPVRVRGSFYFLSDHTSSLLERYQLVFLIRNVLI
ncbi:hypothetical protein FGIG_06320 [Fasciola gigantica]|uniref:Uncharacterized protein n=1 Tax=Fasciola gigantica TaxID=46835 RepID=A0A504YDN5_FASGI|nr:hypothetical protein FGIG_06320 [Fasciola gigantica]